MKFAKLILVGIAVLTMACDKKTVKLDSDDRKAGYAIGQQIGQSFKMQNVNPDLDAVYMGVSDYLKGEKSKLTQEEIQGAMMKLREQTMAKMEQEQKANKEKADKFLEENKKKPGVKVTKSGLQYEVISEGAGESPKESSTVKVHYRGTLMDGTEFDSSYSRNEPAEFPVTGVIKGWTEALLMMKKGAKYKLVIPPDLGYGPMGRPPQIPGQAVLNFEVELLDVMKDTKKTAKGGSGGKKPTEKATKTE